MPAFDPFQRGNAIGPRILISKHLNPAFKHRRNTHIVPTRIGAWSLFCWNSSQCHNEQDMNAGDNGNIEIVFPCVVKPGGRISSNNSQLLRNDYRLVYRYSFVTPVFFIIHHHHPTSSSSYVQECQLFCPEYDWPKNIKTLELGFTYRCLALLKQSYHQNGHINRFFFLNFRCTLYFYSFKQVVIKEYLQAHWVASSAPAELLAPQN